jgi:hypothetical protein
VTVRAYLSTISPRWPVERQEAEHAAKTPGWPDVPTYRDKLSPRKRMSHSVVDLKERRSMLRPHSRQASEAIYVASFAVLAFTAGDFMDVVAAASARRAAIVTHESGRRIEPNAGADVLRDALAEFQSSKRRSERSGQGGKPGGEASAAKRLADVTARVALIADAWKGRVVPTTELLLRAGRKPKGRRDVVPMAYQTAAKLLGKRPAAQKKADTDVFREQRRQEALARKAALPRDPDWLDDLMKEGK